MIDKYTGKKIVSPLDTSLPTKPTDHSEVATMGLFLKMAQESLCPPKYAKFCSVYNELIKIRCLPLKKL
jgi:hypothetical protein